jgi:hypothetical protein
MTRSDQSPVVTARKWLTARGALVQALNTDGTPILRKAQPAWKPRDYASPAELQYWRTHRKNDYLKEVVLLVAENQHQVTFTAQDVHDEFVRQGKSFHCEWGALLVLARTGGWKAPRSRKWLLPPSDF